MFKENSMSSSHDIWTLLAGSPELRTKTSSVSSSFALDRPQEDTLMETESFINDESEPAPPILESVTHLQDLDDDFVYAYFERELISSQFETPMGVNVLNAFPVLPRKVYASRVIWKPVLGHDGVCGHRYDFVNGDGEIEAHAEVFVSFEEIHRVALVHRLYTPLARASGLVDENSLLEFNSPASHYRRLVTFLDNMQTNQFYLPLNELAVGSQIDIGVEIDANHTENEMSSLAQTVWSRASYQLRMISNVSIRAARQHNSSEFSRTGLD